MILTKLQRVAYIKGFFKPTPEAATKLAQLGITNTAHYTDRLDGLWGSVTVPQGVFKHTRGNPGLPGRLDLAMRPPRPA